MSIQITVSNSLFKSLQNHAIPFLDTTPESVIERWAKYFDEQIKDAAKIEPATSTDALTSNEITTFNPLHPPDLSHTRVRGAFGTAVFSNWNDLLRIAHIQAFRKALSYDDLRAVTHAQIRNGSYADSGYRFIKEIGISLQGVDANRAWPYALKLAQYLKEPIMASIEWRNNDNASHPGKSGILSWKP